MAGRKRPWDMVILEWTLVFAFNLILPVFLASLIVGHKDAAWITIGIIVLVLYCLGMAICIGTRVNRDRLLAGGIVAGLSQFLPIIHFFLGSIVFGVCVEMNSRDCDPQTLIVYAAAVTAFVGGNLMFVAWGFGYAVRELTGAEKRDRQDSMTFERGRIS